MEIITITTVLVVSTITVIHRIYYTWQEIRAGRKLGHLNGVVDSPEEVPGLVRELKECERQWK